MSPAEWVASPPREKCRLKPDGLARPMRWRSFCPMRKSFEPQGLAPKRAGASSTNSTGGSDGHLERQKQHPSVSSTNSSGRQEETQNAEVISAGGFSEQAMHDTAIMIDEIVKRGGARHHTESQLRPDGVRGVFATRDLAKDEAAIWVADREILNVETCDPVLLAAIDQILTSQGGLSQLEVTVFRQMIALTAGTMLEQAKGEMSKFYHYVKALPEPPPTINTYSKQQREAANTMLGSDAFREYGKIIDTSLQAIVSSSALWTQCGKEMPSREAVESMFFFVLSRMSYMRMIPIIDLANAASPGQDNAAIRENDDGGCSLTVKRDVQKGDEIVIDYNHHNSVSMMCSYGCSLGMEFTHAITKLRLYIPNYLEQLCGNSLMQKGAELCEDNANIISEEALMTTRMASMGNVEDLVAALKAGFFDSSRTVDEMEPDLQQWKEKEKAAFLGLESMCLQALKTWESKVDPVMVGLNGDDSEIAKVLRQQDKTERRLFQRCADLMRAKAS